MTVELKGNVCIIRDFITKTVIIETRDHGLLLERIRLNKDNFLELKERIKDVEI
jgi:hypothetical protein